MNASTPVSEYALKVVGVEKAYGRTRVLSDVSFGVKKGSVHALVGENGAGKSTLVKIITGVIESDAGEVRLDNRVVRFKTPTEARAAGIAAVYQDPKLFPHLDVTENIFMGAFPSTVWGAVDRRAMREQASATLRQLGVDLDLRGLVAGLSIAELQFVEIARALSSDLQILILDEPTSSLTPAESSRLFEIVARLKGEGKSILFISHRLEEVEAICDEITILRDGRHVATSKTRSLDRAALVQLMVGRPLEAMYEKRVAAQAGREALRVERLGVQGVFTDVSFTLHVGEIVGMAGLVGAGRSEIAQALFGMNPPTEGRVTLDGRLVTPSSPGQMLREGLAYLPEDRDGQGLIMAEPVVDNVTLPIIGKLGRLGLMNRSRGRRMAEEAVETYQIRTTGVDQIVAALSGGNRQKVAFAKWLATAPSVLILDEPTHGVDVGSKAQIHKIIAELADKGLAVLVISSDLLEVLSISERILVVAEGRLVAEFSREQATQEAIMAAATANLEAADAGA